MTKDDIETRELRDVACYFINKSNSSNEKITNKKLQKLVYYAQVWHYTLFENKLFNEQIEAWVHGPAVPSLYRSYKIFEFNPIKQDTSKCEFPFSDLQTKFLDNVWEVYGHLDASYLEALTHSELPWQEARRGLSEHEVSTIEINLDTAREYYGKILQKD